MLALVKEGPGPGLSLRRVPRPEIGINDVLVRVRKTGICGTDLHIESWDPWAARTIQPPLVVGHEFVGEVVEVGSNVTDFHPGELVSGEGHLTCGRCRHCLAGRRELCAQTIGLGVGRDGAFAEFVALPMTNIWHHWPGIDEEVAAIFDPFGNAVHTALAFPVLGEDVLVSGAGPIGLMAAAVARHVGARYVVITDVSEPRLELARKLGADLALNVSTATISQAQRALGMREGFDIGLEMSGHPGALPEMISNMNHGGRIAMLGLPSQPIIVDWAKVVTHMITVKGIYGREMFETWYAMSAMLQSGAELKRAVTAVVTDRYAAQDWAEGFARARSGSGGKVVLDWSTV